MVPVAYSVIHQHTWGAQTFLCNFTKTFAMKILWKLLGTVLRWVCLFWGKIKQQLEPPKCYICWYSNLFPENVIKLRMYTIKEQNQKETAFREMTKQVRGICFISWWIFARVCLLFATARGGEVRGKIHTLF